MCKTACSFGTIDPLCILYMVLQCNAIAFSHGCLWSVLGTSPKKQQAVSDEQAAVMSTKEFSQHLLSIVVVVTIARFCTLLVSPL